MREKLALKVCWVLPHDVIVLARIEVEVSQTNFLAGPAGRDGQGHGEARFEVRATAHLLRLGSEVGNEEACPPNFRDYLVVDLVDVLFIVDAQRFIMDVDVWQHENGPPRRHARYRPRYRIRCNSRPGH